MPRTWNRSQSNKRKMASRQMLLMVGKFCFLIMIKRQRVVVIVITLNEVKGASNLKVVESEQSSG